MNRKCLDALMAEHKTILRAADVLDAMATKATNDLEYDYEDVRAILQILRVFGDECHQAKEEGALFPVFASVAGNSQYAAVRHMLFEHERDRSLIDGMESAIQRSNAAQFIEYARRLASILRNHIYKEDNILFETMNAVLSAQDDERILADFETFDRDFDRNHKDALIRQLRLLEWKYLRKAA
jgi:hemerythrin-like domain-containing protein